MVRIEMMHISSTLLRAVLLQPLHAIRERSDLGHIPPESPTHESPIVTWYNEAT